MKEIMNKSNQSIYRIMSIKMMMTSALKSMKAPIKNRNNKTPMMMKSS